MKPTLAKTSFQSGPDEALAATDVYNAPTQTPIGGISDTINAGISLKGLDSIKSGLSGGINDFLSKDLTNIKSNIKKFEEGIKTVTKVLNGDKSLINDLKKGMVGDLLASAGYGDVANEFAGALMSGKPMDALGQIAKMNPELRVVMDGVDVIVGSKDINSVESLFGVVSKLTGIPDLGEVFQIGPQLSMIKGLIDKANELGIPELAKVITDSVKDPKDKKILELNSALSAAQASNLEMLQDIINKHGASSVTGLYPNMVKSILTTFRFPVDNPTPDQTQVNKLINMCDLLEPNWYLTKRNGEMVPYTECLITVSRDAKTLLLMNDALRPIVMAAEGYISTGLVGLAQKQYPYTPLSLT